MATTNKRIRFADNNHAELTSGQITKTSELAAFPFTNSLNKFRSRVWKPSGHFLVDSTNDQIYINDGADKTISITQQAYATAALLATEIETQLNTSSANWTVSYDTAGETYRFTIGNSGSVSLRLSQTTNAIWSNIGYTTSVDLSGTSFIANEQRNHSYEEVIFDLGYNAEITFFAMIGPLDEAFSLSDTAVVKLQGSNLNQWTAPPLEIILDPTDEGIFQFLDSVDDSKYRFWRIYIEDKYNTDGPSFSIGHIYIGDYVTLSARNVKSGFQVELVDPSESTISENGAIFFDRKQEYHRFNQMVIPFLTRADKDQLRVMFRKLGKTTPFYLSIDPRNAATDSIEELTKYVVLENQPIFTHVKSDFFTMTFSAREVL